MSIFGFLGKKNPTPQAQILNLPEIPSMDELDIPPPPAYIPTVEQIPVNETIPYAPPEYQPPKPTLFPASQMAPLEPAPDIKVLLPEQKRQLPPGPLFVSIDDFRQVLESTQVIKDNLKEAGELVTRIHELRDEEDKEFEKWRFELEDIQKKLTYVDKIIFESG